MTATKDIEPFGILCSCLATSSNRPWVEDKPIFDMPFHSETHKLFSCLTKRKDQKERCHPCNWGSRWRLRSLLFFSYTLARNFMDDWCIFIGVLLAPCLCKTSLPAFYLYVLTRVSSLFHLKR